MNRSLPVVIAVDVGSVRRPGGFAWATADGLMSGQDDPSEVVTVIVNALEEGRKVAVAFECPLSVPVPEANGDGWRDLGRARVGEGSRPWSAGAGTGSLATGLVQLTWVLSAIKQTSATSPRTTTQLTEFLNGDAQLFVAEAMVTSAGKPELSPGITQDQADAYAAAKRLGELLEGDRLSDISCEPHGVLNLAAVAAIHAGLDIEHDELHKDVLVAKTTA